MNRASTSSWGLLGPTKHWAKAWKLGIDKVQRDVGDSACGPALQRMGKKGFTVWASSYLEDTCVPAGDTHTHSLQLS